MPVVRYQLSVGGPIEHSAAIVASWARYATGVDEHGQPIEVVDRRREEVMARTRSYDTDPIGFLRPVELFGDLSSNERFVAAYLSALRSLYEYGAQRTLEALVD